MSSQADASRLDNIRYLGDITGKLRFNRISPIPYVLPGVFLFISLLFISIGLGGAVGALLERAELALEEPHIILSLSFIQWGTLVYLGYVISAVVSSYFIVSNLRRHFHDSGIYTYYYTHGSDVNSLLQYLQSIHMKHDLPSTATSLILGIFTGGLSYIVLLQLARLRLERHIETEEQLFGYTYTRRFDSSRIVLDIALIISTLGAYLAYCGYKFAKLFNRHIERIHVTHEGTILYLEHYDERGEYDPVVVALVIILVFGLASIVSTSLGLYYQVFYTISSGLLFSYVAVSYKKTNSIIVFLAILLLLYVTCILGFINGFVNHGFYEPLYQSFRNETINQTKILAETGSAYLTVYIFINNFAISLPAIIPYMGGVTLASGCYNAGVVLGAFTYYESINPIYALTILIYPHAILELLAYSLLATASSFFNKTPRDFIALVSVGIIILLLAAYVEALLILAVG